MGLHGVLWEHEKCLPERGTEDWQLSLLSCRQGNVKSSSAPDKEESSLKDADSTTQLANNTLNLDYLPYLSPVYSKELFSHVSMQGPSSPEGQDSITPPFTGLRSIITKKLPVQPHLSNASIHHFTK